MRISDWSSDVCSSDLRFLVIADVLGKSVALAHNEREVSKVFDIIDPLARNMAGDGRVPGNRKQLLKLIGESLLVQHRVAGRVAVEDKPDVQWDRPELGRRTEERSLGNAVVSRLINKWSSKP